MSVTLDGSVLQLVVFLIDNQRYALPLVSVERVLPMVAATRLPTLPDVALGVINVHGQVIPIVDIRPRLGFPPKRPGAGRHVHFGRRAVPEMYFLG